MPTSPYNVMSLNGRGETRPQTFEPSTVNVDVPEDVSTYEEGVRRTELADGSVLFDLNPRTDRPRDDRFDANLANELEEGELNSIATELLEGIARDDASRKEWLADYKKGIDLLGLKLKDPNSDISAPTGGISNVDHPLLLQAVLFFQAMARGELLPASGPVKIRDDRPARPPMAAMPPLPPMPPVQTPLSAGAQGAPVPPMGAPTTPPGAGMPPPAMAGDMPPPPSAPGGPLPGMMPFAPPPPEMPRDELADAFEQDFNHYLTTTAKEYYPDTDQMLFLIGFGGYGTKKVYNCPLRRRPVSESVPVEDFIVSDTTNDLSNASRITHAISMRPSVLKRMQLMGVYRDVDLGAPTGAEAQANEVQQAKAEVSGVQPNKSDPLDADYELYETLCELDLPGYEHKDKHGKVTGLKLPYRVVIERESQQVLEIRRNWREDDPLCMPREYYVDFYYDRAFGFYGFGLLQILGNTTKALTAVWREFIDGGMFANFPGFIYNKGAGRQLQNNWRIPPGGGIGLDTGLQSIRDSVMPVPYKDQGPVFTQFIESVTAIGQQLGGTANTSVGEGKQDAPVGTTLALIEQQTKAVGAVIKRLYAAQAKEFQLLKDRFKEDPSAFWRFNPRPAKEWSKEEFVKALNDYDLVPVADPNNPTSLHRAAKSQALVQYQAAAPGLLDPKKVFLRVAKNIDIEAPEELLMPPPPPGAQPQPDPTKMAEIQGKMQVEGIKAQGTQAKVSADMQLKMAELQDRAAERANKLQVAEIERQTEQVRLAQTLAIHADKTEQAERALQYKFEESAQNREHNWALEQMRGEREIEDADMDRAAELHRMHKTNELEERRRSEEAERAEMNAERERQRKMEDEERAHARQLELHSRKEATALKLAKMKPKPKPAAKKKAAKK